MSMALADVDGNGTLDLYVANFRAETIRDEPTTKFHGQLVEGRPVITAVNDRPATLPDYTNRFVLTPSGKVLEFGEPDVLYLNDGRGHFAPCRVLHCATRARSRWGSISRTSIATATLTSSSSICSAATIKSGTSRSAKATRRRCPSG